MFRNNFEILISNVRFTVRISGRKIISFHSFGFNFSELRMGGHGEG